MSQRRALPKICIALGLPDVPRLLEQARREADSGENFLEFRLDYLPDPVAGVRAIEQFLDEYPNCTILATCRRHQNHGKFNGSIDDQLKIYDLAITAGARAIDIEIETAELVPERCAALRTKAQLVVSWHHFETTPPLDPVMKRMRKVPADVYKIVSTARKPTDVGRILAASRQSPKIPLVTLAMGELGFPSRVLSPALGAVYTYAAPAHALGTAAGQINARQLRSLYRMDKFTKAAKIFGVVADPVRHSVSPYVHNRAFQSRRIDAVYVPLLVSANQLRDFFQFAEGLPLSGFSVTIPHKRRIMRYLDHVDPLAKRIGAVNTLVVRDDGSLLGRNTDAFGFLENLRRGCPAWTPAAGPAVVIGAGGAARAVVAALIEAGLAEIRLVNRGRDRAEQLAADLGGPVTVVDWADRSVALADAALLVNTTTLGMTGQSNLDLDLAALPPTALVNDIVYVPLETDLLARARMRGNPVVDGLGMLLWQAAPGFEAWFGVRPEVTAVLRDFVLAG